MTACTRSTLSLASQARKYGLGLIFATQSPKGLHNQIPGNAATQFFGLLNAPAQIEAAREMAKAKGGDVPGISRCVASSTSRWKARRSPDPHPAVPQPSPCSPLTKEEVLERSVRPTSGSLPMT